MTTTNVYRELSSPRTHYLTTKPSDAKSGAGQLLSLSSKGIKATVLRQLVLGHTTGRCQSGLKSRLLAPPSTLSVSLGFSSKLKCRITTQAGPLHEQGAKQWAELVKQKLPVAKKEPRALSLGVPYCSPPKLG